jgi:hypothetical protein
MCPAIDNPAICEIRFVIGFLHNKIMSTAGIHSELWAIFGQNLMSEGNVKQWCRLFKYERTNIHDEEGSGLKTILNE